MFAALAIQAVENLQGGFAVDSAQFRAGLERPDHGDPLPFVLVVVFQI